VTYLQEKALVTLGFPDSGDYMPKTGKTHPSVFPEHFFMSSLSSNLPEAPYKALYQEHFTNLTGIDLSLCKLQEF